MIEAEGTVTYGQKVKVVEVVLKLAAHCDDVIDSSSKSNPLRRRGKNYDVKA